MAKQKIVIRVVSMKSQKSRSKAMKIAVGVPGVESAAIHGDSKDEIEVAGENVDSVKLTSLLRKKFCHAVLVSVGEVKKKEEKKEEAIVPWTCVPSNSIPHCYPVYEIRNPCQCEDPSCSIM